MAEKKQDDCEMKTESTKTEHQRDKALPKMDIAQVRGRDLYQAPRDLAELCLGFLSIGAGSFGGVIPTAYQVMLESCIEKRNQAVAVGWISPLHVERCLRALLAALDLVFVKGIGISFEFSTAPERNPKW